MAEYLYLVACIPHTTSTIILIYLNCILAGLNDCKGEEATGYIDDIAHNSIIKVAWWEFHLMCTDVSQFRRASDDGLAASIIFAMPSASCLNGLLEC